MNISENNSENSPETGNLKDTDTLSDGQPRETSPADPANNKTDKSNRKTEHGGPKGLEPTRYGDWERNGRCTDF